MHEKFWGFAKSLLLALLLVVFGLPAAPTAWAQNEGMMPVPPVFGVGDIIEIANNALAEMGPKGPVYPRVIKGGVYSPDSGRVEFESALLAGAPVSMGVNSSDQWSAFSYAGLEDDSCAWFFPLTVETESLALLRQGYFSEVVFLNGQRTTIQSPVVRLDAMAAVCLVDLQNVGARALTKNAGILSFVLVDGETRGNISVALSIPPSFVENFTGGNANLVPAVIINGMPGKPVALTYVDSSGEVVSEEMAKIEKVNGTLSVQLPSDGGYVIIDMPLTGSSRNANTEVLFRLGSQPLSDTPGKNWVPLPESN